MKYIYLFLSIYLFAVSPLELHATYVLKNGKIYKQEETASFSVQEHFSLMMGAYEKKKWAEVASQSNIITKNFTGTPFADEALFFQGVAYYHLQELEESNRQFSSYLKRLSAAKHFEEAITYKFKIAEEFRNGAKRRVLGWKKMPKLVSGREKAIKIYDEVLTALPNHDLAAQSLFGKGELLLKSEDFRTCIETYQTLIRRFPKHYLAPESYLGIGRVYLDQCQKEFPDPDFLELAEINFRKFKQDFPGESRHQVAQSMLNDMKEIYAKTLFDIAEFYERTKKTNAARIYYSQIMQKYSGSKVAQNSQTKLDKLPIPLGPVQSSPIVQDEQNENFPKENIESISASNDQNINQPGLVDIKTEASKEFNSQEIDNVVQSEHPQLSSQPIAQDNDQRSEEE